MIVINEPLLQEFREKTVCEWCRKTYRSGLDPHHIFSRGAGRVDIRENLLALCRECHLFANAGGEPTKDQLLEVAAKREKMTPDKIVSKVYRMRRYDRCKVWNVEEKTDDRL